MHHDPGSFTAPGCEMLTAGWFFAE